MNEGEVVARGLVVPGRDGAEALESVKEDFHEVALGLGVDYRPHAARANCQPERIRVVACVADERASAGVSQQLSGGDQLVALAGSQRDVDRPRLRVDDGVEFC